MSEKRTDDELVYLELRKILKKENELGGDKNDK